MLKFINSHIKNKCQSLKELSQDLIKGSILCNDDKALMYSEYFKSELVKNKYNITNSLNYNKCIERISESFEVYNGFLDKDQLAQNEKTPSFLDIFCGAGGMSEGFTQASFNCDFACDLDGTAAETFYLNHKTPFNNFYIGPAGELVKNKDKFLKRFEFTDVVIGGPPCQGFSNANRQRLIDDPRNHLYKDFLEILAYIKPKFLVLENVAGLSNKIDDISKDIQSYLGSHYDFDYSFLNAKDYGCPQNRKRFILIANSIGVKSGEIFSGIKKADMSFVLKDCLDLPPLSSKIKKNDRNFENEDVGFKITTAEGKWKTGLYSSFINYKRVDLLLNHINRFNNERDIEIFKRLPQGANSLHDSIKEIMPYADRNHIFKDKYFKLEESKICKTITSHMKFDCNMYIHPNEPRGLSPREAARAQSFPDSYFFRGSQNSWYRQIGNSVPPKMARSIAESIASFLL